MDGLAPGPTSAVGTGRERAVRNIANLHDLEADRGAVTEASRGGDDRADDGGASLIGRIKCCCNDQHVTIGTEILYPKLIT